MAGGVLFLLVAGWGLGVVGNCVCLKSNPQHTRIIMKKVAIIGASGYSGEELVRLLLHHPHVELTAVTSRQRAGQTVAQVFPRFAGHPKAKALRFTEPNADLLARQAEV